MSIELREVTKVYRSGEIRVEALRGISMAVGSGEFVAIIGSSGSGKTTLLDILGCLSKPTSGVYRFDGRDIGGLGEDELAMLRNERIGFVFQMFHLLPRQSALANVEVPLLYAGLPPAERKKRALAALDRVGLSDRTAHTPAQLSGGQQQRVAVARALVNNPDLILADEPTGNLDTDSGREIMDLLSTLHGQGHTVILVTHDPEPAKRAGRTITVRDGRVVEDRAGARPNGGPE
jgi:putative ABC transport system ATP-binding protein